MRDLASDRCPECGRELRLRLAEVDPVRGPFISGIVAFAAPAGAGATGVVGTALYLTDGSVDSRYILHSFVLNGSVVIISLAALFLWLRLGRWLRRHERRFQWMASLVPWAFTLIGYVLCLTVFS